MKKIIYFLIYIFTGIFFLHSHQSYEQLFKSWQQPVEFTPAGIARFFKYSFNQNSYGQNYLSTSLEHLTDFLDFGIIHNKPTSYFKSTLELFHQRFKETPYLNNYALTTFLDKFSHQVAFLFFEPVNYNTAIKNCIRQALHDHENSEDFFNTAAEKIHTLYYGNQKEPSQLILSSTFIRFLESLIDKVIWNPQDQEYSWYSFLTLAEHFETLYYTHIIPDTLTLNHLIWSLVYRYCYFISCWGSELNENTYKQINTFLDTSTHLWLSLSEQEKFLVSKKQRLKEAAQEGLFKLTAKQKGILSDIFF